MARADVLIGRLHQLPTGGVAEALDVALRVFGGIADVELVERAAAMSRLGLDGLEAGPVDLPDAHPARDAGRRGLREFRRFRSLRAERPGLAARHLKAGKV